MMISKVAWEEFQNELEYLRKLNKDLLDRLMARDILEYKAVSTNPEINVISMNDENESAIYEMREKARKRLEEGVD